MRSRTIRISHEASAMLGTFEQLLSHSDPTAVHRRVSMPLRLAVSDVSLQGVASIP